MDILDLMQGQPYITDIHGDKIPDWQIQVKVVICHLSFVIPSHAVDSRLDDREVCPLI